MIVMTVRVLVRILPRAAVLGLGSGLGRVFYVLHGRRRELAVANLRAAFPSKTDAECRDVLRSTFGHFGRHAVELLAFDAMSASEMLQLVELEGEERVEQAMARGHGAMFYTGHFGYWELQIMVHAFRFKPIVMVARTLDNPLLERLIERVRTRVGTRVIPRQGAIRGLLRALLDKESVGMMIDQHIQDRSAVSVDFFNRPASTTSAVAALALRTGVPIIPVFALPLPAGRYRMIYEAPVAPPAEDDPDPVRTYTQRCTDVLEMYVRRYPDLWLWMHRRWRTETPSPATPAAESSAADSEPTEGAR
jgi:KDO2-lipid IV(A) lauroyltransferase